MNGTITNVIISFFIGYAIFTMTEYLSKKDRKDKKISKLTEENLRLKNKNYQLSQKNKEYQRLYSFLYENKKEK